MLLPSPPSAFLHRWIACDRCLCSELFVDTRIACGIRSTILFFSVGVLKNGVWDKLLRRGFSVSCFSKGLSLGLADGSSRLPILGTPNLSIGSLRVGHVPRHEQSLLGMTPVDSPGEGWRVSQLQPVFLGWCHPGAAPESKPESRAKPGKGGESL